MSASRFDVIVIGSGMGGTSAAGLCARAGLRTLLLEKNPRLGGSCSYYEKRGFHIDYGTHMFSRGWRGPLGQIQRRLGIPRERRVRFVRTRDIAVLRGQGFELKVPSNAWRMPAFALDALRTLRVPLREIPRVVRLFKDIATMSPEAIAEWDGRTVEDFLLGYTDNARLFGALGLLLGLYFILPFWEVSAGEAIWCFQKMALDNALSYPVGGSYAIPKTICDAAARFGARIETRVGAAEIVPAKDGLRVTTTDGRELHARAVVSTTSLRELADGLCPPGSLPAAWSARAAATKQSYIAVQAKIALRRPRETAGCLVGSVSRDPGFDPLAITMDDYRVMFADIEAGRVPKVVPIYCPIPTNFDAALGPPGTQLLTACMVAPTTDVPGGQPSSKPDWVDSEKIWIDAMMRAMEELVPGLREDALFIDTMGVQAIASWIGKRGGPAVSTGQTPGQSGARRPGVRTPVRGLYVAGDGAGARGVGTELACASGMECADALLADAASGMI